MNNLRKIEIALDELSEDFNEHLAKSKATYYYLMNTVGETKRLNLNVYSKGGEIECEILMLSNYQNTGEASCVITLDGEVFETRVGVMTISPIPLKVGYHALEFTATGAVATARVRLTGALSDSKETLAV
ncbi:MAG: hypothetical protein K2J13_03295 [Clostridia bacterium]|nr:hypothetical protein [Clostridia bacterium]